MFVPPLDYLHLEFDYGQAELRVVAELAQDKTMIDIFERKFNIHVATAVRAITGSLDRYDEVRKILKDENHPENEFWERQKKKAKTINFGILYGQGDPKLAEGMGVSLKEAKEFKAQWFAAYPQVVQWIKKQERFAKKYGYVESIWGYKRRLPDIWSTNEYKRAEAMRQAVNAPIQGAASDYALFSAIIARKMRLEGKLPDYLILRIAIHDALVYYLHPNDHKEVTSSLVEVMANPDTMEYFGFKMHKVRMKASPEIGLNWALKKDYNPEENYHQLVAERDKTRATIN